MRRANGAAVAIGAVLIAAAAGSRYAPTRVRDAAWYARLEKPRFRPPGAAIGVAWTLLDAMLAYSGARLLSAPASPAQRVAVGGWAASVSGLVLYPWLMFGRKRLGAALGAVGWMLGGTAVAIGAGRRVDRTAARALGPLVGWLGFAGVLQEEIWRRNR